MRKESIERWVALVGIVVLASVIMFANEVRLLREQISEAIHKTEVNDIRSGLIEAWVKHQVSKQSWDPNQMQNINPLRLVSRMPQNYLGEFDDPPEGKQRVWFYDLKHNCLIFVFSNQKRIGYRLELVDEKQLIVGVDGVNLSKEESCN